MLQKELTVESNRKTVLSWGWVIPSISGKWVNHNIFLSQFWRPEIGNQARAGLTPSGSSEGPFISHLSTIFWQLLTVTGVPWSVAMCCAMLSHLSHLWLFATVWTIALQDPLSMVWHYVTPNWPSPSYGLLLCVSSFPYKDTSHWIRTHLDNGLPRWHSGKESTCQCRRHKTQAWPLGREDPLE